jgi:hypothetical protein
VESVLPVRIAAVAALCRETLDADFRDPPAALRRPPEDWFRLLHGLGFPRHAAERSELLALAGDVHGWRPDGGFERYALIQAMLAALPRLPALAVDAVVKRLFCGHFTHFARPEAKFAARYDIDGPRYTEMAELATLRHFPAGQHDWWIDGLPRSWLLRVHPKALPALARVLWRMGGFGPLARLHINHWRPNQLMLLEGEAERSYHRIARSLALCPGIKGLMGTSWFYAPQVPKVSPHLAWMRGFFAENGAFLGEMERASAARGFLTGSARRRELHESGRFHPRTTLVLWPRAAMLAWAESRKDLQE